MGGQYVFASQREKLLDYSCSGSFHECGFDDVVLLCTRVPESGNSNCLSGGHCSGNCYFLRFSPCGEEAVEGGEGTMLKPRPLGKESIQKEELKKDRKEGRKFGPCGV